MAEYRIHTSQHSMVSALVYCSMPPVIVTLLHTGAAPPSLGGSHSCCHSPRRPFPVTHQPRRHPVVPWLQVLMREVAAAWLLILRQLFCVFHTVKHPPHCIRAAATPTGPAIAPASDNTNNQLQLYYCCSCMLRVDATGTYVSSAFSHRRRRQGDLLVTGDHCKATKQRRTGTLRSE
jgi:hypothetical protein